MSRAAFLPGEGVSRREAPNVGKAGGGRVLVSAEEQEIGDGQVVEPVGNVRMPPDTVQGIAEHQAPARLRIIEGLDAQVVPGGKQPAPGPVPDGKGEIADKVQDTVFPPGLIGVEDEFDIGNILKVGAPACFKLPDEVGPAVYPGVGGNPDLAVLAARLAFRRRILGSLEQGMTQTHRAVVPDLLRVGAPVRHEFSHLTEQLLIHRLTVNIDEAHHAAHLSLNAPNGV